MVMLVSLVNQWAQGFWTRVYQAQQYSTCIVGPEDGAGPVPETCVSAFRSVRKIAKSDCSLRHACTTVCIPSVRMEQFGSHCMDFHGICYFSKICPENSSFIKTRHQ